MKRKKYTVMEEKPKCDRCGKDAIGFQSMEGGFEYVCIEHADGLLLALKPGEKKAYGVCYLERYS
jgi:hypothetical protein